MPSQGPSAPLSSPHRPQLCSRKCVNSILPPSPPNHTPAHPGTRVHALVGPRDQEAGGAQLLQLPRPHPGMQLSLAQGGGQGRICTTRQQAVKLEPGTWPGRSDPTSQEMPPSPSTPHLGRLFPQREATTQAWGCCVQGEPQVHRTACVRPCMGQGEDGLSPAYPTGPQSPGLRRGVSAPLQAARSVMDPERLQVSAKDSRPLRKASMASSLVSSGPHLTNPGLVSPEQPAGRESQSADHWLRPLLAPPHST